MVGKQMILADDPAGGIWVAPITRHGLGTAKKPVPFTFYGSGASNPGTFFYTVAPVATAASYSETASATAAPTSRLATGHPAGLSTAAAPIGTKNFYDFYGSGPYTQDGTMTINGDGTWSLSGFYDRGNWVVVGNKMILNDTFQSFWMAAITKHGLASATKPGMITTWGTNSTDPFRFYTVG